jgi:hypothetical protein
MAGHFPTVARADSPVDRLLDRRPADRFLVIPSLRWQNVTRYFYDHL